MKSERKAGSESWGDLTSGRKTFAKAEPLRIPKGRCILPLRESAYCLLVKVNLCISSYLPGPFTEDSQSKERDRASASGRGNASSSLDSGIVGECVNSMLLLLITSGLPS